MNFKHGYTILDATATEVTIHNPHGDGDRKYKIYNATTRKTIAELKSTKNNLTTELKDQNSFLDESKTKMDKLILQLSGNEDAKEELKPILNKWISLSEKGLAEKNGTWVFPKKKFSNDYEDFLKKVDKMLTEDISKGFVLLSKDIKAKQIISYQTLEYFSSITISIIK